MKMKTLDLSLMKMALIHCQTSRNMKIPKTNTLYKTKLIRRKKESKIKLSNQLQDKALEKRKDWKQETQHIKSE